MLAPYTPCGFIPNSLWKTLRRMRMTPGNSNANLTAGGCFKTKGRANYNRLQKAKQQKLARRRNRKK